MQGEVHLSTQVEKSAELQSLAQSIIERSRKRLCDYAESPAEQFLAEREIIRKQDAQNHLPGERQLLTAWVSEHSLAGLNSGCHFRQHNSDAFCLGSRSGFVRTPRYGQHFLFHSFHSVLCYRKSGVKNTARQLRIADAISAPWNRNDLERTCQSISTERGAANNRKSCLQHDLRISLYGPHHLLSIPGC